MFDLLENGEVSAEAVIEGIRKEAAMHPERRYAPPAVRYSANPSWMVLEKGSCSYFEDRFGKGKGHACIVGESLYGLGLDPEGREPGGVATFLVDLGIQLTDEQTLWLEVTQRSQDKRVPWGMAVELADEVVAGYRVTGVVPEAWRNDLPF